MLRRRVLEPLASTNRIHLGCSAPEQASSVARHHDHEDVPRKLPRLSVDTRDRQRDDESSPARCHGRDHGNIMAVLYSMAVTASDRVAAHANPTLDVTQTVNARVLLQVRVLLCKSDRQCSTQPHSLHCTCQRWQQLRPTIGFHTAIRTGFSQAARTYCEPCRIHSPRVHSL